MHRVPLDAKIRAARLSSPSHTHTQHSPHHQRQQTEKEKESHNENRNSSNLSCRSVNWNNFIHASISKCKVRLLCPMLSVHGQCQLVRQMKCTWTWTCTNNFYIGCRRIKSRQALPVSLAFAWHEFSVSTNAWWQLNAKLRTLKRMEKKILWKILVIRSLAFGSWAMLCEPRGFRNIIGISHTEQAFCAKNPIARHSHSHCFPKYNEW